MLLYENGPGFRILPGHERTTPRHERTILMPMSDPNKPQTEFVATPAKDDMPRESFVSRLKPFILVFLLVVLPVALFHAFTDYMHVYRIPAGTKAVDRTMVPMYSPLARGIFDSGLIEKWKCEWIVPYLLYRHYVIPDGVEEIRDQAFIDFNYLRSVRIPAP